MLSILFAEDATPLDYTYGGEAFTFGGVEFTVNNLVTSIVVIDNQDMSASFGVAGRIPSALFIALFSQGYIPVKPEGVRADYLITTVDGPLFGWDVENEYISGWDEGAWGAPPEYFTS